MVRTLLLLMALWGRASILWVERAADHALSSQSCYFTAFVAGGALVLMKIHPDEQAACLFSQEIPFVWRFKPRALITFIIVENSGFPLADSAL